ncbi:MAG: formylglycine-generating enzyme family protein [Candidatus Electrothrix sp. ATG2]|nr:formylglycine-generating enzyme family protein [Candidatus Electrothrix sp. ATG2]
MPKENLTIHIPDGPPIELVYVQGDIFIMGSDDPEAPDQEKPAHQVKLSDFHISKYPVTQDLWLTITGSNPSNFKGEKRPVEQVSWDDVHQFLVRLNQQTGKKFRLPTEAEWEYAARGGQYCQGYRYAGSDRLKQVGWYEENSNNQPREVGLLLANELGLHDMSGNVCEWCQDRFSDKYYEECHKRGVVGNPQGPDSGTYRVLRGGSWIFTSLSCRSVDRLRNDLDVRDALIGFRLVLPFQADGS